MEHSEKPLQVQSSEFDEMLRAKMKEISSSSYYEYVFQLKQWVIGKTVAHSQTGTSGFVLFFTDNDWVISYLQDRKLHWERGEGEFRNELLPLLNSSKHGDGSQPLSVNLPYASQTCDMGVEVAKAHGKEITGVAIGEEDFNFCFPDGLELDANIVPTTSERYALRVFWEQW
jgi:hypothetical protein